jgi:hypothetical protein
MDTKNDAARRAVHYTPPNSLRDNEAIEAVSDSVEPLFTAIRELLELYARADLAEPVKRDRLEEAMRVLCDAFETNQLAMRRAYPNDSVH